LQLLPLKEHREMMTMRWAHLSRKCQGEERQRRLSKAIPIGDLGPIGRWQIIATQHHLVLHNI